MELEYDYKEVDWKEVRKNWDKAAYFFNLTIIHGNNKLTIQSFVSKEKKIRLMIFVNGRYKGEYDNEDSPFRKYLNVKTIQPDKSQIQYHRIFDRKCKKMTAKQIIDYKGLKGYSFISPFYDNITQIKKMVTALE